jgi:hypothetical protein
MKSLRKLEKLKVETIRLNAWIHTKHLKNIKVFTTKPKSSNYVEVMIEFVPIKENNGGKKPRNNTK